MEISLSLNQTDPLPTLTEHQPIEFSCAARAHTDLALTVNGQVLEPFLRPNETVWRWRWNPGALVGLHQVVLTIHQATGETQRTWSVRVHPRKVDQERYEALLADLQQVTYRLIFTLTGGSAEGASFAAQHTDMRSPIEDYFALFEQRFASFEHAVRRIADRPREHHRDTRRQVRLDQATVIDADVMATIPLGTFDAAPPNVASDLQEALRPGGGLLPRAVSENSSRPTTDSYEHRLLKHLLWLLLRRASVIDDLVQRTIAREATFAGYRASGNIQSARLQHIATHCTDIIRKLQALRAHPLLADVGMLTTFCGATPLLQRDAAYREIYRMWQALHRTPHITVDSPLFSLPITDLPRLYECWCVLQVAQALLDCGGTLKEQQLLTQSPTRDTATERSYTVALTEQTPLLVITSGTSTLTLRYQPRYRPTTTPADARLCSLDRHVRIPDIAIEICTQGSPPRVLILDAKYRQDPDGTSIPQDALAEAYAYFGAIGYASQRATTGAFLLYPGTHKPELYPSGVGAIPLLPGDITHLTGILAAQLHIGASNT